MPLTFVESFIETGHTGKVLPLGLGMRKERVLVVQCILVLDALLLGNIVQTAEFVAGVALSESHLLRLERWQVLCQVTEVVVSGGNWPQGYVFWRVVALQP